MKIYVKWYPISLTDRAKWHKNFTFQANQTGTANGLTAAEVTQIEVDSLTVTFFNDQTDCLEFDFEGFRAARDAYLDGDRDAPKPEMPTFTIPVLYNGSSVAIAERTERYSDKIKASDNYSPSVGEAYGIVSTPTPKPPDTERKPVAKPSTRAEFKVAFRVTMTGMKGIQMQMERDGDPLTHKTMWMDGDIVDDTPPLVAGKPETRRYRFYFLEKNQIVGVSSDIYEVTVHP